MTSKVVSVEDCGPEGFRWITLKRITWEDPSGRQRLWESAERTTRRGDTDGVAIVAKILRKGQPPLLPVLKQYRPPVANYCLELPAGLVDGGESAGQAAVRELLEETGYRGQVVQETPICVSDPGMSNANMRYVTLEVDGDAPENQNVVQQLEDGEFIQVELVPWGSLMQHLLAEMAATGCEVDARLLSYAFGLEHAKEALAAGGAAAAAAAAVPAVPAAAAAAAAGAGAGAGPQPAQRPRSSDGLESGASWAPLPFGSPILSPQASIMHPPAVSLGSQGPAGTQPAGRRGPASLAGGWPLFVGGVAAGAAGCLLLRAAGR